MLPDEDRRRLLESLHDIGALKEPGQLTTDAVMQAAVVSSRDALQAKRGELKTAASLASLDQSETDAARVSFKQLLAAAIGRYGFIRVKAHDALLNIDPDMSLGSEEIARRQKLFDRVFKMPPSGVRGLAQREVLEVIAAAVEALSNEPELQTLGQGPSLAQKHLAAENASQALNRELDEDTEAVRAVRKARQAFDRLAEAHTLLVRSVLARTDRSAELGRFVLAKDAAYAARRAAGTPLNEEPGVAEIDAEVPAATTP